MRSESLRVLAVFISFKRSAQRKSPNKPPSMCLERHTGTGSLSPPPWGRSFGTGCVPTSLPQAWQRPGSGLAHAHCLATRPPPSAGDSAPSLPPPRPSWEGCRFRVPSQRGGLEYTVRESSIFFPTGAFQRIHFFKARTPTDSAEMSHRSRQETDREPAPASEGHWQGDLTVPAPPPPHAKTLILTSRRKLLCMNAKSMIRSN